MVLYCLLNLNVNTKIIIYADELLFFCQIWTYSLLIDSNISKNVKNCFDNNLLEYNLNKYKYINFNTVTELTSTNYKIFKHTIKCNGNCINCIILDRVNVIKYSGVTIDRKLKWNHHINHILHKIIFIFNVVLTKCLIYYKYSFIELYTCITHIFVIKY